MDNETRLREELEHSRKIMQILWEIKESVDEKFISASDEFDFLLNEFNKITKKPPSQSGK